MSLPLPSASNAADIQVHFKKTGLVVAWSADAFSLLEFAENQGLLPEFSCRSGICGTCRTGLLQGQVSYFEEPLGDVGADHVLLCCTRPASSLVLDL